MINDKAYEVKKDLFDSLKKRNQNNLQSMKDSEFVFDYVHSLYYKRHKKIRIMGIIYRFSRLDKK